jgi:hypothetical protein
VTTTAYTLATTEDENGTVDPAEALWTPTPEDAASAGFINHEGLFITGVGEEGEPPAEWVALGHHHTWSQMCRGANAYMQHVFGVPDMWTDPDTRQHLPVSVRTPLPVRRHAVFLRHPHPDQPCGCEWDGTWRLVYVDPGEPGAIEVTVMRRPTAVTS